MPNQSPKVIIIGGGLAGPVLALSLKKHGITAVVFEARGKNSADGGFLALAPNALRMLDGVGIYDKIKTLGYNYEKMNFTSARNLSVIGAVNNGNQEKYGYRAIRVGRGVIRQTVLAALSEEGIELHYGAKCTEIIESAEDGVTVKFANGMVEQADYVIGADGIHSRVRKHLDPLAEPTFTGQGGIGSVMDASKLDPSAKGMYMPCMIFGLENSFALMPCTYAGDKIGFFATVELDERSRREWEQLNADKQTIKQMLIDRHVGPQHHWPKVVQGICQNATDKDLFLWPYFKVPALKSFISPVGRAIVIGDAAHAFPPTGGQGAAMALEDAATLADVLAKLSEKGGVTRQGLERWQAHRMPRLQKVAAFTSKGGDMRKSRPSAFQAIVKEWLMWAYFAWTGKDKGMKWIYSYRKEDAFKDY